MFDESFGHNVSSGGSQIANSLIFLFHFNFENTLDICKHDYSETCEKIGACLRMLLLHINLKFAYCI